MAAYDYEEFDGERLHRHAVRMLVDLHRADYDELAGRFRRERVEYLEREIVQSRKEIAALKALNPKGLNADALEQTLKIIEEAP